VIGTLIPYLTALRIESGLTTQQAARLAGLSGEVVKKWEDGRTTSHPGRPGALRGDLRAGTAARDRRGRGPAR
jgi:hypothetical protein